MNDTAFTDLLQRHNILVTQTERFLDRDSEFLQEGSYR